jgi:hypothetical protein
VAGLAALAFLLCAATAAAGAGGCAHRPAWPPNVTGRVIDERGAPVAGVTVVQTVTGWSHRTATTDARGVFVLPPLPLSSGGFVVPDHPMDPMVEAPIVVHPSPDMRVIVRSAGVEQMRFGRDATATCQVGLAVYDGRSAWPVHHGIVEVPLDGGTVRIDDIRLPAPE